MRESALYVTEHHRNQIAHDESRPGIYNFSKRCGLCRFWVAGSTRIVNTTPVTTGTCKLCAKDKTKPEFDFCGQWEE